MTSGTGKQWHRTGALVLAAAMCASLAPPSAAQQARGRPDGPPVHVAPPQRPTTIAQRALDVRIGRLGRDFNGLVGIAVREVETGWTTSWNGNRPFPQQSVSKFWVALTAYSRMDAGEVSPDDRITIRREDLTLFHQPIAARIGPNGFTSTLDDIIFRALTTSDNTCNDAVLRHIGGPERVRAMLARNRIEGIRFGPGERLMQSQIAGLQWRPSYSVGRAFFDARDAVPAARRRSAFDRYVEDPVDGAAPLGIVDGLARLQRGELLSRRSTARLLSILAQVRTGPQRLRGGLAPGWTIGHKTGTGQELGPVQAGYNDIGILTSPEGRHYAVAVMIGRTAVPIPERMQLMQNVTRAVIAYNDASRAQGVGSIDF